MVLSSLLVEAVVTAMVSTNNNLNPARPLQVNLGRNQGTLTKKLLLLGITATTVTRILRKMKMLLCT